MSVGGFKFTVQPIKKALVNTDIHPVIAETEVFTHDTVMALVWVVGPAREELTGPRNANGDLIPSLEVTLPNQMIVQASPPTDLKNTGGAASGAASSSSDQPERLYFVFQGLHFTIPATYRIAVRLIVWDGSGWVNVGETLYSGKIEVVDDQDPQEEPCKKEKKKINKMSRHPNLEQLNLPNY